MDLLLSPEQQAQRNAAAEFARTALAGDVERDDREGVFPQERWRKCAEFGVQGLVIPPAYGGSGASLTTAVAVMEGLGYGCADHGLLFALNAHLWACAIPILQFGTEAQKQTYLPGLCRGELIGANAASEADAGSDVFSMRARVTSVDGGYAIEGSKCFVSNAPVADVLLTYASMDPSRGAMAISAFIIDRKTNGISVGKPLQKMGLRTAPMAEVAFEDVRVPAANLLGREGRGVEIFAASMEWERACILASCLGTMQRQLEECIAYARQRKQFGQAIGKFQSVANRIVDMKVRLETARPLVYQVAQKKDAGDSAEAEAALAKLYVSEAFVQSSLDAVRVHGGYGYMSELPFERQLRDSVGGLLYSGTSDIQRNIIARKLGL